MKDEIINSSETPSNPYTTLIVERRSPKPTKPESEDATFARGSVLVVADGVSRNFYDKDVPSSPAAKASRSVTQVLGSVLQSAPQDEPITREMFQRAFTLANESVQTVNANEEYDIDGTKTTLWENPDFFKRDLAGAVASAVVRRGNKVDYGFIGDCRIFALSPTGQVVWEALTPQTNKVSQAKEVFDSPSVKQLPPKDDPNYPSDRIKYIQRVHQEYRNNPSADHPTYGVLTGQPEAVDDQYLVTGSFECEPDTVIVLSSDGLDNYFSEEEFRNLVAHGTQEEIADFIDNHPEIDKQLDDKALLISRRVQ
jgi:serine/threonine protein phosphatase PrpC